MKRSTDEIRYFLLKLSARKQVNIEYARKEIATGLQSALKNAKDLERMGFLKIYETKVGKRMYREIKTTNDGRKFLKRLENIMS